MEPTKQHPTLSVVMIVKNESEMLARCLNSVRFADEIIICDTGSTDHTIDVARLYTNKIFTDYKWNDNFAEARNHALSKASCDWVLSIDADEVLEPCGIKKIKNIISQTSANALMLLLQDEKTYESHWLTRLFKRQDDIYWVVADGGYVHETVNAPAEPCHIVIQYGQSPTHTIDPTLDLRLLMKSVNDFPENPRNYYYLGRELYHFGHYRLALDYLQIYISKSSFMAEKADAFLIMSRCYWQLHLGDKARESCLNAININANFKEAVLFMAEISWQHNAEVWRNMATHCNNSNVLFVRK